MCTVPGCTSCDVGNICVACPAGQQPNVDGDACVECTGTVCTICNIANVCEQSTCNPPQLADVAGNACFDCAITDCLNCNENDKCARCTDGLVPSADGSACVTCSAGCNSCDANGNCL